MGRVRGCFGWKSAKRYGPLGLLIVLVLSLGVQPAISSRSQDRPRPVGQLVVTVSPSVSPSSKAGATASPQTLPSPPFTECPADGQDTSCGVLVVVTDSGFQVLSDPSQGPLDGIEDTLTGVLNQSSGTVSSLSLSANTDLFGFDGDGLCAASPHPSGCPFGPTGYEGPGVSFSNINPGKTGGVVSFSGGIPPGGSGYFSLEEALTAGTVFTGGPSASEQNVPNPSEHPTTCSTGKPVNCGTGVFWHGFDDLSVPGRGVALAFTRTYNSAAAATDGPLGFGWTDSYNMSLAVDPSTGDATVSQEDGATVTFVPNGSGGFVAAPRVLAKLVQNGDGSYTFTRNADQIHFTFSSTGQLVSEVDRNGYQTSLSYNGSGQLATVTDPAGRTLSFAYSGSHIASVTDPVGRVESFAYGGSGNLTAATDPAGGAWSFGYDGNHRLLSMTDPNGGTISNVYDGSGRVTSQTDPMSRTTTWSYSGDATSPAGGTTTMTDAKGTQTTFDYQNLELLSETRAAGTSSAATTTIEYDPATLGRTKVTDPNGHPTTASYDASGNLISFTDALNRTTTASYNSFDEPTTVTDPSGVTTTRTYDGNGNLLSVSRPLGSGAQTVTLSYSDGSHPGDVTSVTDPNGKTSQFSYDADGNVASIADPLGDTSTFGYDAIGRLTSSVSPRGNAGDPSEYTTSYQYDPLGRLTETTDPLGHATTQSFDGDGNLTSSTDGNGNTTSYGYDADNELTTATRADGTTLSYGYDANGNQTSQTDGAGKTTSYAYDPLNRVMSVTDPLNRTTSYGYDAAGNRTGLTNPSGKTTSYGHDAANELTSITYSDGTTPNVSFTYTANGLRATMHDGTGQTTYTYDSLNRLVSQTNGNGQTVSYGYDLDGNLTSLTYPNGKTVSRSYDAAGRLTAISDWLGHTTSFTVDPDSNTTATAYPNGVTAASVFDRADQLSSISDTNGGGSTLAAFSYTRDANGQLTGETPTGSGQGTSQSYGYDPLNQLTSVNSNAYSYDSADNLTNVIDGAMIGYDAANEATSYTPSGGSPTTLSYDQQGNRLNSPSGASYTYDQANRLVSATGTGGAILAGGQFHSLAVAGDGTVWAWGYNADGELGDGTTTNRLTPVQVSGLSGATAVAAGDLHSLALANGSVESWGSNVYGQLGDGTTTNRTTPVQVSGLSGVTAVAAGNYHSLALKSDGSVVAWGFNGAGELGDGTTSSRTSPVAVQGLADVTAVAAGGLPGWAGHSVALESDGSVWTWGYGKHGQLGLGSTSSVLTPQQVPGLSDVVAIAAGGDNTYALKSDGTVWAWGDDGYGQLGNTSVHGGQSTTPVQVNISDVAAIVAGGTHVLALKSDGTVWAWGNNNTGQLGDGGACGKTCTTPVQITGLTNVSVLAAGYVHSLAAHTDGTVSAWGSNSYGQLGDGTSTVRPIPVSVSGLGNVKPVSFQAAYDGDGLRATATGNGTSQQFAWDLSGGLPLLLSDGSTSYLYDDSGLPVEQIDSNGTPLYYQHDQLGSTRLLTDQAGAVAATFRYDPYGNLAEKTGNADTALRWAGQYQDESTGLYYLRARYYDPQTGQFLTVDPLSSLTGEMYTYVGDSPLHEIDPFGLSTTGFCVSGELQAVVGAATGLACMVKTNGPRSQAGFTLTVGGGAALRWNVSRSLEKIVANLIFKAAATGSFIYQTSNANCLTDLGQWFTYKTVSFSFGIPIIGPSISGFKTSFSGTGSSAIRGTDLGVGISRKSGGITVSGTTGATYTWVFPQSGAAARGVGDAIQALYVALYPVIQLAGLVS